jgi:hypothetical protein
VEKVLKPRYDEFKSSLEWIRNKREVGVKAYWRDHAEVIRSVAERNEALTAERDRMARLPPAATFYERIALGDLVKQRCEAYRNEVRRAMQGALAPLAEKWVALALYGEDNLTHDAYLLADDRADAFEEQAVAFVNGVPHPIQLKFIRDLPPYNFVTLEISLEEEHVHS